MEALLGSKSPKLSQTPKRASRDLKKMYEYDYPYQKFRPKRTLVTKLVGCHMALAKPTSACAHI